MAEDTTIGSGASPTPPGEQKQTEVSASDLSALWGAQATTNPTEVSPQGLPDIPSPVTAEEPVFEEPLPPPPMESLESEEAPPSSPIEGEIIPEEPILDEGIEEEHEGALSKLDQLLAEINLTKKHVLIFLGCGIVFIVALIFGIRFVLGMLEKKEPKPKKPTAVSEVHEKKEENVLPLSKGVSHPSIRSVLYFGRSFLLPGSFYPGTDIALSFLVGHQQETPNAFGEYVFLLRRLQNAYQTDVTSLLASVSDRRGVLNNYVTLLRKLFDEAKIAHEQIKIQKTLLQKTLDDVSQERDSLEKQFSEQLNALNPQADQALSQFLEKAQEAVRLKAETRSLERIEKMYTLALTRVEARIKDVELNREALIKGLKVIDVPGSDLNLVKPLGGE